MKTKAGKKLEIVTNVSIPPDWDASDVDNIDGLIVLSRTISDSNSTDTLPRDLIGSVVVCDISCSTSKAALGTVKNVNIQKQRALVTIVSLDIREYFKLGVLTITGADCNMRLCPQGSSL